MSASDSESSIYLSDTDKQIKRKIGASFSGKVAITTKHSFLTPAGGQETRELHRELGGRTEVDIPYQYLKFFLEDDEELERIRAAYEKGEMETSEIKAICTRELTTYVGAFRERRKTITDETVAEYMRARALEFQGTQSLGLSKAEKDKEIAALEKRLAELRAT
jgi:tryptophanyl-tRNA synthetase